MDSQDGNASETQDSTQNFAALEETLEQADPRVSTLQTVYRHLITALQTENSFPELLPSWNSSPVGLEPSNIDLLITSTGDAKAKAESTRVARLEQVFNEAHAHRTFRLFQLLQIARLKKILLDPSHAVNLQESNKDSAILEPHEQRLAASWKQFCTDHEWILPELPDKLLHVGINPSCDKPTTLRTLDSLAEPDSSIMEYVHEVLSASGVHDQEELPASLSVLCFASAFRSAIYKSKLISKN